MKSACFNPVWIRKTSKKHQISTDSSFRFERGTDPNGTIPALIRAASLICEMAGGRIASEIVDVYPEPVSPYPVTLTWKNLDRLIGVAIDRDEVKKILLSLEMEIIRESTNALHLAVPTYRVDVRREADVIEEILRIYGYNQIGIGEQVTSTLAYAQHPDPDKLENLISEQLTARGFHEIMANSLTQSAYYDRISAYLPESEIKLMNPLSSDLAVMRRTLLFGGLESISLNTKFRNPDLQLYEFGNLYSLKPGSNRLLADSYQETRCLGLWITGKKEPEHWTGKQQDSSLFELKSAVESILLRLGADKSEMSIDEHADQRFHSGLTYRLGLKDVMVIGQIHPDILNRFDLIEPVWFAEINWDILLRKVNLQVKFQELPKYPWVRRDLALMVDQSVTYDQIRSLALLVERKLIREVNLFDVYVSDKLGPGKKSMAISFILQDENKTLIDNAIDSLMKNIQKKKYN